MNLTNVKKGLVLKKMQVNQGFEMAVGEDCESYKCQKRTGTEEKNASQSGFEMAVGEEWDWRGERHSTVGSGDTREEEEEEEKAEGSEV